jgi:hypothetical protein
VGDTIIITERLYARDGNGQKSQTASFAASLNNSIVSNARSITKAPTSRKPVIEEEIPDDIMTLNPGVFIGERTVAAHVIRDNYRTARDASGGSISDKKFYKLRRLWLEVIWQKASNEACKPYELKPGVVIERQQAVIERFEVFRVPWSQEPMRMPLREELSGLTECFLVYDKEL